MTQINHPDYYQGNNCTHEAIEVIEAHGLGFHLGNVLKYILRAGKKNTEDELTTLNKAKWYLERYIELLKEIEHEQNQS